MPADILYLLFSMFTKEKKRTDRAVFDARQVRHAVERYMDWRMGKRRKKKRGGGGVFRLR